MRRTTFRALIVLAACAPAAPAQQRAQPAVPETRREAVGDTLYGVAIPDPYRWLEDQQAPETRRWIAAQNAYTDSVLGRLPGRERIARRLAELFKVDVVGTPFERGGRYFF